MEENTAVITDPCILVTEIPKLWGGNTFIMFVFAEFSNTFNLQWNGNTGVCEPLNPTAVRPGAC